MMLSQKLPELYSKITMCKLGVLLLHRAFVLAPQAILMKVHRPSWKEKIELAHCNALTLYLKVDLIAQTTIFSEEKSSSSVNISGVLPPWKIFFITLFTLFCPQLHQRKNDQLFLFQPIWPKDAPTCKYVTQSFFSQTLTLSPHKVVSLRGFSIVMNSNLCLPCEGHNQIKLIK